MNWEERMELTMQILAFMMAGIVILAFVTLALVNAPGPVIGTIVVVTVMTSIAFGLTYVPQLLKFVRNKWENRK